MTSEEDKRKIDAILQQLIDAFPDSHSIVVTAHPQENARGRGLNLRMGVHTPAPLIVMTMALVRMIELTPSDQRVAFRGQLMDALDYAVAVIDGHADPGGKPGALI